VLTNIPGRIFLECGPDRRAFDNVWTTNGTLVFKGRCLRFYLPFFPVSDLTLGVCGRLWSENIIGASVQGRPCFWRLVDSPPPQPAIGLGVVPLNYDWTPVQDWKEAVFQLLRSPSIKIRIAENT
jgi:hypothetical protein